MTPSRTHLKTLRAIALLATLLAGASSPLVAKVSVTPLFGSHMVCQRDRPIPVWGTADPGEDVTVSMAGNSVSAITAADGKWAVMLPELPAGGPHTLTIKGSNELVFQDVLVGEVWLASGQSNMEWDVRNSGNADLRALTAAARGQIRELPVKGRGSQQPQSEFEGSWTVATRDTVGTFSAVAYAFAQTLHEALGVPVGIIENSWGGSSAEAWVDRSVIAADPVFEDIVARWQEIESTWDYEAELAKFEADMVIWEAAVEAARAAGEKGPNRPRRPQDRMTDQHRPGNLWNARVLPVAPFPVRGVIWYQGESNASRALQYRTLFPTLISEWRLLWGRELPFYWVQLADFHEEKAFDPEAEWPALREAQTMTQYLLPATGQAVIIDIGEGRNIHPQEKEEVGRRLARWALNRDYGFTSLAFRSPEFAGMQQDGDKLLVKFSFVGEGLRARDTQSVHGFVIKDETGNWTLVEGEVTGPDTVTLQLPSELPVLALRYAWADNPVCNLFSKEGLPATPFRTDVP